jgi:O-antigen ligase
MKKITINFMDLFERGERIFAILSLLLYMNAVIPLLIIKGASEGDGVSVLSFNYTPLNLLFILNYLITASLLILRWNRVLYFASQNLLFIALLAMAPISFIWSAMPDETFSGSVGMIGSTLFGVYLASRFTLKEQLHLIGWAFGLSIILSIIFVVALPRYGIMGALHAGSIRGVWTHKNVMGKYMVLSTCVFLILTQSTRSGNIYPWLGLVGSAGLILASASTNALLNGILITLIILLSSKILRLGSRLFVPIILLSTAFLWAFSAWFTDVSTAILTSVGKDPTLTGRTDIWNAVIDKIQERPWLGYGFNGFWHGIEGESAYVIRTLRWSVPNSHNGYLDFILQLGLIGFALLVIIYWSTLIKSYLIVRNDFQWEYLWPLAFLLYLIPINLAEPALLTQNDFFWIIFTIVVWSTSIEFKRVFNSQKNPDARLLIPKSNAI